MIAYDLKCRAGGHAFEGWFGSARDYSAQKESGLLVCPMCGSSEIEKALSVPNVGRKSNQAPASAPKAAAAAVTAPVPQPPQTTPASMMTTSGAPLSDKARAMLNKIAEVQAKALKQSEWVGHGFVEEVRAQHYGEADQRKVHGEASIKDAAELAEEGIDIMPIMFPYAPPKTHN